MESLNEPTKANVVLQVHKSHLSRMKDFISSFKTQDDQVKIVSTERSASKTCSLMFLSINDVKAFSERLIKLSFVFQALNKSYVMMSSKFFLDSINEETLGSRLRVMLQKEREDKQSRMVVKVDTFPPKIQRIVVTSLLEDLEMNEVPQEYLDIAPTNYTHTLSIIQVKQNASVSFLIGIASAEYSIASIHRNERATNDDVCRAYYKLAEAFDRYKSLHDNGWPFHNMIAGSKRKCINNSTTSTVGVDCGAAPGGWTKYLVEQTGCEEVYSIDPGLLSDSVLSLPNVHHLQMTGQEAMPMLKERLTKRKMLISIWVSDMCVHEVAKQVDMLLFAKSSGIFRDNFAFVLTIKCNVGHSETRFEELTKKEVDRLNKAGAYDVMVVHLFSNRIGERTVIGRIK
jgi:23S rRNA U2552 (ribose-2'-O)-methylase RlmE/FtsJ